MAHEHVYLFKRALVEELGYALARCVFAAFMLLLDGFLAATQTSLLAQGDKLFTFSS